MTGVSRDAIFIGHANPEDNAFTVWLGARLTAAGYEVWAGAGEPEGRLPPVLWRAGPDGRPADAAHRLTPPVPAPPSATDAAPERDGAPARARTAPDGPESATFRHTWALRFAPDARRDRLRRPGGSRRLATDAGTAIIVQEARSDGWRGC